MKVVQYLMGYAHMDVTMDVYNHITEQSRIETELTKLNSAVVYMIETMHLESRAFSVTAGLHSISVSAKRVPLALSTAVYI